MKKVKSTIPVYDICSISGHDHINADIIAEPLGQYLIVHPNLFSPHRHTFYHMVLFTAGSGHHTIDFEEYAVRAGQVYFMSPGQVHSWNFDPGTDGFIINFSEQLFQQFLANKQYLEEFTFFRSVVSDSVITLTGAALHNATRAFGVAVAEMQKHDIHSADVIRAVLVELFVTVQRQVTAPSTGPGARPGQLLLYNFRKLVNAHYAQKRLPKDYAAMLYITPNHLNALCNDLLGKPAGEVIRDRILLEAKRELVNADLSIAEIAFRLNFTDNSHFTKFFKKYTGVTPEEFMRTL